MNASDDNKYNCPGDVRFGESIPLAPAAQLDREWVQKTWFECNQHLYAFAQAIASRRTEPAAAQLDAELPPPDVCEHSAFSEPNAYSRAKVEQIVAPYAERIRQMERERAEAVEADRRSRISADQWASLEAARIYLEAAKINRENRRLAYIDGRTAGTAPEGWKLVPEVPTEAMIVAIEHKVDEQLVASGMWVRDMQRQDGADIYEAGLAAAPSPQSLLDEVKNG